jgi:histidine triad (HIT) family protein
MTESALTCLFCSFVSRSQPVTTVFEDDISMAFLDHRPIFKGHTLLVPKKHTPTLPDLALSLTGPFFRNVQLLCTAVKNAMGAEGTFVAINNTVSQSVPHLHVHIVPRKRKDGLKGFFWPRTNYESEQEMEQARMAIRSEMTHLLNAD